MPSSSSTQTPIAFSHQDVFVTRLYRYDLNLHAHHDAWQARIDALRETYPKGGGQRSVRHGWKGDFKLFDDPLFAPLAQAVRGCINQALKAMGAQAQQRQFSLEGSINITDPQGYNRVHGHAQNLLSGCYYLNVPEHSGGIEFHEPRLGAKYSPLQPMGVFGSQAIVLQPKAGQLILFPSWLEHAVQENQSNQSRYSIPINAKPLKG